jgi:hypothetical protein
LVDDLYHARPGLEDRIAQFGAEVRPELVAARAR